MPNQYTKFQAAAAEDPASRAFTWREWTGKKQRRGPSVKKRAVAQVFHDVERRASSSDESIISASTGTSTAESTLPSTPSSPLLLYLPSGGFRIDPFRSYPVAPNHEQMAVLDHFLYILAPSGKLNEVTLRRRDQHVDPHINLLLPYVMQDACLFDAMLAGCQASISLSSGLSAYSDPFFIVHRGRAMAALRRKLARTPDSATFVIITLLLTCDYLLGDLKAVEGHTRALQRMIEIYGHLPSRTKWDRFVKNGVEAYKYIGLVAIGSPEQGKDSPLDHVVDPFQDLDYPEPPFAIHDCEQWTNLAPGFMDLVFASQLSTQLCAIIAAFDHVATEFNPTGISNLRVLHPIQAALQRFTQHKQATYLERCIAAGLMTYSFQHPKTQAPNMFHDPPLQGMLRLFSVNYQTSSRIERDALIWALVVTQGFMALRTTPLPKSQEIFRQFITRNPRMKDWSYVERALCRFLWTPRLLERWRICYYSMLKDSVDEKIRTVTPSPRDDSSELSDHKLSGSPMICPVSGHFSDIFGSNNPPCPFFQPSAS